MICPDASRSYAVRRYGTTASCSNAAVAIRCAASSGQGHALHNDVAREAARNVAPHLIEVDGGHFPRTCELDARIVLDAPRSRRHHHDAVREHDGFFDGVRDKN